MDGTRKTSKERKSKINYDNINEVTCYSNMPLLTPQTNQILESKLNLSKIEKESGLEHHIYVGIRTYKYCRFFSCPNCGTRVPESAAFPRSLRGKTKKNQNIKPA